MYNRLFFGIILTLAGTIFGEFPQALVDRACTMTCKRDISSKDELCDRILHDTQPLICGYTIAETIPAPDFTSIDDYWLIGPGYDTVTITADTTVDMTIYVIGDGVFIVDGAMLTMRGSIGIDDNGTVIFREGAHLHFDQFFVGQYYVYMLGGSFEAYDATIDANGVLHFAELHNNSVYIAQRCYFPDWTFRKLYDNAVMMLEDVHHVGDFLINDSVYVSFLRCDTLMPWFYTPTGSNIDIVFPPIDFVEHFEMSESTPNVDGIGYTFIADSCGQCWWSMENFPGCTVIIRDSDFRGTAIRIPSSDTFSVSGIENFGYYPDLLVPLSDRHLEFINTTIYWWNWYSLEHTVFYIDSCWFGEMISKDSSTIYATNCLHDGWTITLSTIDDAFMWFDAGSSEAYVSTFDRSTMLISNSRVVPLRPYQTTNIAHNNSNMLCVNCDFDSLPFAMDTALVMWVDIDSILIAHPEIPIYGSAWLHAGPYSTLTFDHYCLYWKFVDGDELFIITESSEEVFNDILGTCVEHLPYEAMYIIRLTIWNSEGDSLSAMDTISIVGVADKQVPANRIKLSAYPNPFNSSVAITAPSGAEIEIYDIRGNVVMPSSVFPTKSGSHLLPEGEGNNPLPLGEGGSSATSRVRAIIWRPAQTIASGIYIVKARTEDGGTAERKIVLVR